MTLEHDKRAIFERRRNILYLIAQYLDTNGLHATKSTLIDEAHLCNGFVICDNIDLDHMYLEFFSYYRLKFGKTPKIARRLDVTEVVRTSPRPENHSKKLLKNQRSATQAEPCLLGVSGSNCLNLSGALTVTEAFPEAHQANGDCVHSHSERIKDCVSAELSYKGEWKELADHVYRNLFTKNLNITWDDILGADAAKAVLKESVMLPLEFPELFSAQNPTWRGLLVHGCPGVGKTMLAKALSSESNGKISFFNITPSSIISKWRGESEKLLRILFEIAQQNAPSVIFIDEIDSFASKRDNNDHEATKRFKNEFLTLLDGFSTEKIGIFLLVTSNMPWEIDPAFLRRFERKVLLDLPTASERQLMIEKYLPISKEWPAEAKQEFCVTTEGFTGDDVRIACKEANLAAIRSHIANKTLKTAVQPEYLRTAISHVQPLPSDIIRKHRDWNESYGTRL